MRLLILFVVLVFSSETYSQQKIFYISIPPTLKQGSIIFDLHADPKDSMFTITFGGFLKENEEVGFFLLCDRGYKKVMESSLNNGEILSPETTIDSLNKLGRSFFRKNIFYALFIKGGNYYIHKAKGEYIYMSYKNE